MAINSIKSGITYYTNDRGQTKPYHNNADIYIERGGIAYIRNNTNESENQIPNSIAIREILPEHPSLSLRDIRLNFKRVENHDYVSIYNRHTNEMLKQMPKEDFLSLFGKITSNRNNTFELYV